MTNTEKAVVGAGVVAALVIGYAISNKLADDDDRPPIIVKGGSLYFDNTSPKRPGKPWKQVNQASKKEWELDHNNGKPVSFFALYFPNTNCAPVEVEEAVVNFDHDGDATTTPKQFTIKIAATGKRRPIVASPDDMEKDTSDATRLIGAASGGQIASVSVGGSVVCTTAGPIYVESIKQ